MRTVHEGSAFFVQRDDLLQVVVVRRRSGRLEVDEVPAAFHAFADVLAGIPRGDWSVMLDMRDAPLRNDEDFERAMGQQLMVLMSGFRRRALLVKTAVGALQVNRAARSVWGNDDDTQPSIFRDEAEAMHFLHS